MQLIAKLWTDSRRKLTGSTSERLLWHLLKRKKEKTLIHTSRHIANPIEYKFWKIRVNIWFWSFQVQNNIQNGSNANAKQWGIFLEFKFYTKQIKTTIFLLCQTFFGFCKIQMHFAHSDRFVHCNCIIWSAHCSLTHLFETIETTSLWDPCIFYATWNEKHRETSRKSMLNVIVNNVHSFALCILTTLTIGSIDF